MPRDLEILITGSSGSDGTPNPDCVTRRDGSACASCTAAMQGNQRNIRFTSSAVVRYYDESVGRKRTVLIDCGGCFSDQVRALWGKNGLREIDAVILTHSHDDASDGIGQLRTWTSLSMIQDTVEIWGEAHVEKELKEMKPWLYNAKRATGSGVIGHTTWRNFVANESFELFGMPIMPLRVEHGKGRDGGPYPCLAFVFDKTFVYASDQHNIPEASMKVLKSTLGNELPVLLTASLRLQPHPSHFGFGNACWLSRELNADHTYQICLCDGPSHEQWGKLGLHLLLQTPDKDVQPPTTWADYEPPAGVAKERLLWFSAHTEAGVASDDTKGFIEYAMQVPGVAAAKGRRIKPSYGGLVLRVTNGEVEEAETLSA